MYSTIARYDFASVIARGNGPSNGRDHMIKLDDNSERNVKNGKLVNRPKAIHTYCYIRVTILNVGRFSARTVKDRRYSYGNA